MVAKKMLLRPLSESSERPPIIRRTAACARAVSHSSTEVSVCTISKERRRRHVHRGLLGKSTTLSID